MSEKLGEAYLKAWRLFITSHAKLIQQIDADLQAAGQISLSWYDVLIELYEAPEKRLRMTELAERVVLSRSGLTRLVDRLEERDFLRRETDPQDRRGFYVLITEAGISAMRMAWPVYAKGIQGYFADALSAEEAAVLAQVFGKILGRV
jgi:DNA-binding MarR family transcriptional regulator